MLFNGLLDLPWWGLVLITLGLTHITIASVTIYLHRNQAHRALDLHPVMSHFFRLWLWLTTGMVTKEWTAIHRKHHAKCETADDPHSPQVYGINRVLWTGVFLYVKESHHPETMERYGHGTPDDWVERNVYAQPFGARPVADGRGQHRAFRPDSGHDHPGRADRLDPVLGRRRDQRHRPLLGLPQLGRSRTGREQQHLADRHADRRRGAAQQPPRLSGLGQVFPQVVRVRPWLGVHPAHGVARPGHGEEGCADAALLRPEAGLRRADAARR